MDTCKRTSRSLTVAAATLAGVGVLSGGLSGYANAAEAPMSVAPQSTVAVQEAGVLENIAQRILGQAGSSGVMGLFDLLTGAGSGEDPNAEDFAEIKDQLTGI